MTLLAEVLRVLEREQVPHALIGAAALAVRGVSRSTADIDLLCVDAKVLRREAAVVVGRHAWEREIIEEAEPLSLGELTVPVARPAGLVLLKLHAGGPKDAWDIRALLEASDQAADGEVEVDRVVPRLPADARSLWSRLRAERQ
jgi:hypothetical protein